jgi:tetratricopeptide (TPR) repeat protein
MDEEYKTATGVTAFSLSVAMVAVLTIPAVGRAQDDETTAAKEAYGEGKQLYAEGKYEEAIDKFTVTYNLTTEPNLLFNLAACAERMGDADRAIAYYEVYLEEVPDAEDAGEVRKRVERLRSGGTQTPAEALKPEKQAPPKEAQKKTPAPKQGTPQKTVSAEEFYKTETEKDKEMPVWPPLTIGLGGMVLVGGVITAVLAHKEYKALEGSCKLTSGCTDSDISKARGLAIGADVQFGVGVCMAAAGVIGLVLLKKKSTEDKSAVTIVPGGMMVEGRF